MTYAAVHDLVARLQARTGIEFTLRMLRHTRATELIRSGMAIEVVARLLTHSSSTTTSQTYVHLDVADIRDALRRAGWDDHGTTQVSQPTPAARSRLRPTITGGIGEEVPPGNANWPTRP